MGCLVEGCGKDILAHNFCRKHYKRWKKYGDPLALKRKEPGTGWVEPLGYIRRKENGRTKREHRRIVEKIMGKPLDAKHPIHHVDGRGGNNLNTNLVVCEDHSYHFLLEVRTRAYLVCGNGSWRKCPYCKQYDDPEAMNKQVGRGKYFQWYHARCKSNHRKGKTCQLINHT